MSLKVHAFTQCNMFLMNKHKQKHKSVVCNLIKSDKNSKEFPSFQNQVVKPRSKNVGTQCYRLPLNLNKKAKVIDKSTNTVNSPQIKTKVASVQTVTYSWPPLFEEVIKALELQFFSELSYQMKEDHNNLSVIQITTKRTIALLSEDFAGEPMNLFIWASGHSILNIIFKDAVKFNITKDGEIDSSTLISTFKLMTGQLGHVFCPGINPTKVENVNCVLPKGLHVIHYPFTRYQSRKCEVFYEHPRETNAILRNNQKVQCKHCRYVGHSIAKAKKRKATETPNQKLKRQRLARKSPIKSVTPKSKTTRLSLKRNKCILTNFEEPKLEIKIEPADSNNESSTEISSDET